MRRKLNLNDKAALMMGSAFILYAIAFPFLFRAWSPGVGALLVLPVATAAWTRGLRAAVVAWILCLPLTTLLYNLLGIPGWNVLIHVGGAPGSGVALLIGLALGYSRDLTWKIERETAAWLLTQEKLDHQTERLQILSEMGRAILTAQSPAEIAQAAATEARRLIPCMRISVSHYDVRKQIAQVLAVSTDGETALKPGVRLPLEAVWVDQVGEQDTYRVNDLTMIRDHSDVQKVLLREGIEVYLKFPLIAGGALIGAFNVGASKDAVPSTEQANILREIADLLAIALENARLLETERKHTMQLEALRLASLRLTSNLQLGAVLEAILKHSLSVFDAEDAHIFLYDGQRLRFGSALWGGRIRAIPFAEPRLDGMTYTVARSGHRYVVPDMQKHPLFASTGWTGSIACLPLRIGDEVKGVMSLATREPRTFDEGDLRVVELLADQAAIGIHNAQLYEQVQANVAELEDRVRERTAKLDAALQNERRLSDLKSRFVMMVSHEFRTPLAIIQTGGDLLLRYGERMSDERKREQLADMHRQVQRLTELLDDIMMLSKAETVGLTVTPMDIALDLFTRDIVREMERIAPKHCFVFSSAGTNFDVHADPQLIRQAITKLLSNAIRYSPDESHIFIDVTGGEGRVEVSVRDEGIGIPEEDMGRLFELFHRAANTSTIAGTGLGLAIVRHIIEVHGGGVTVESQLNVGTTVTFHLPIIVPRAAVSLIG